jgi:hypothetical protein
VIATGGSTTANGPATGRASVASAVPPARPAESVAAETGLAATSAVSDPATLPVDVRAAPVTDRANPAITERGAPPVTDPVTLPVDVRAAPPDKVRSAPPVTGPASGGSGLGVLEPPPLEPAPVATPRFRPWRDQRSGLIALGAALLTVVLTAVVFVAMTSRGGATATWATPNEAAPDVLAAPTAEPSPTPTEAFPPPTVSVDFSGFYSWDVLDRRTGARYGSENHNKTTFSESMIKAWIAADFLNLQAKKGVTPDARRTDQLVRMIRDSHNGAAESLWLASGGDASTRRLISVCGLVDTRVYPAWWSQTYISARDSVTMGECIANGTAAGPMWTPWLLNEMRNVRGTVEEQPNGGRWGIIDALPPDVAATVAIKNGWTRHKDNTWNVNCLAIHDDWIMAVMSDYSGRGLAYGANLCATIAAQILGRTLNGSR